MSQVKKQRSPIDHFYDSQRDSWIECYPNRTFIEPVTKERRGRVAGAPAAHGDRRPSQCDLCISVGLIVLLEIASAIYLFFFMHAR
jgi:hypothetical protein